MNSIAEAGTLYREDEMTQDLKRESLMHSDDKCTH